MRKMVWIVILAALAWSGWWFVASTSLRSGISVWFDARKAEGWQAELGEVVGGGFPLTLQAGLRDIALADPDAGVAVQTSRLDISAPAWWPGDVTVALDDAPIQLASPLGRSTLVMQDGVLALNLHPGTALELETLGWTSGPWQVEDAAGAQVQADSLTLTMVQSAGPQYDFTAQANQFAPGDAIRALLRLPDSFPRAFDSLTLQAAVTFDTPWDRRALDTARPQPRRIDLHLAEARWGDLRLNFAAPLDIDGTGTPTGVVSLQAENWRTMLDLAEASGVLPNALRGQAEGILQLLANASGNPAHLDVELTLRDGNIYFAFFPIGPAPKLVLR
ncbi:DUF2125 domain-containing protein [Tateyamaria sp.]|uniref:DUF2125 domain-containing protein n=1 Tax=Tateyamaria sp. TaxID=1929288 RepID=UPI00329CA10F